MNYYILFKVTSLYHITWINLSYNSGGPFVCTCLNSPIFTLLTAIDIQNFIFLFLIQPHKN